MKIYVERGKVVFRAEGRGDMLQIRKLRRNLLNPSDIARDGSERYGLVAPQLADSEDGDRQFTVVVQKVRPVRVL